MKKNTGKNGSGRGSIMELSYFVLGSSRTVYDETTKYAAFRMLQIFQRIANLEHVPGVDQRSTRLLQEISEIISKNDEVLMNASPKEFVEFLDSLVARPAEELKRTGFSGNPVRRRRQG